MTTTTEYTVKASPVSSWDETLSFTVSAPETTGDFRAPWYTVIATPTNTKAGYRFRVWRGSQYHPATTRTKAQLPSGSTRTAVIEAVKAHLAAS